MYVGLYVITLLLPLTLSLQDPDQESEPDNTLRDPEFVHNKDHIVEHLKGKIEIDPDKLSREEMEFHFFKQHDFDNDNRLDGLELIASLRHGYEHSDLTKKLVALGQQGKNPVEAMLQWYSRQVDRILRDDDQNADGYINYQEFATARRAVHILGRASRAQEQSGNA